MCRFCANTVSSYTGIWAPPDLDADPRANPHDYWENMVITCIQGKLEGRETFYVEV
jgi:hypothetical protein